LADFKAVGLPRLQPFGHRQGGTREDGIDEDRAEVGISETEVVLFVAIADPLEGDFPGGNDLASGRIDGDDFGVDLVALTRNQAEGKQANK